MEKVGKWETYWEMDLKKKIHFLRAQNYKSNTEQSSQSWSFD